MAKKPNYNFEKSRKERDRKEKQEEKLRRRRENAADRIQEEGEPGSPREDETQGE